MKPTRDHWGARAADETLKRNQREYALRRFESLGKSYASRVATCSKRGCEVKCGCSAVGVVSSFRAYTCRQHLTCRTCCAARTRKNAPRIREAIEAAWARATRGSRRGVVLHLITLTASHEGGPSSQRERIADGWRKLRKRMWREGVLGEFVGVWEIANARDKANGHVHLHVVMIGPTFWYGDGNGLHTWWTESCPSSSHVSAEWSRSPVAAAKYVAKYVTKGVHESDFSSELRADICAAFYNQRQLLSSKNFWQPYDPVCRFCRCKVHVIRRSVFCGAPPDHSGLLGWSNFLGRSSQQVDFPDEFTGARDPCCDG